jgi:hypothetical protein
MFLNTYEKILNHFDEAKFHSLNKKDRFNDYKKLYSDIVKKDSLNKELINHFLDLIIRYDKDKFIMKTMRMTMCEIL